MQYVYCCNQRAVFIDNVVTVTMINKIVSGIHCCRHKREHFQGNKTFPFSFVAMPWAAPMVGVGGGFKIY